MGSFGFGRTSTSTPGDQAPAPSSSVVVTVTQTAARPNSGTTGVDAPRWMIMGMVMAIFGFVQGVW